MVSSCSYFIDKNTDEKWFWQSSLGEFLKCWLLNFPKYRYECCSFWNEIFEVQVCSGGNEEGEFNALIINNKKNHVTLYLEFPSVLGINFSYI